MKSPNLLHRQRNLPDRDQYQHGVREGGENSPPSISLEQAADLAGVDRRTMVDAKTVVAEGTEDEKAAVMNGTV